MRKILTLTAAAALVVAFGFGGTAQAADQVVNDDAGGNVLEPAPCDVTPDETTIQAGIDAAGAGDTVTVCPGTYAEDLTIFKNGLNLAGVVQATTIIQGVLTADEFAPGFPTAFPNIDLQADGVQIHGFTIESPASDGGRYASGIVIDGINNVIRDNAFKVSNGDPGTVAIQTWAFTNGSQGLRDISGLTIHRNTFTSLDGGDGAFGYEGVFINPQTTAVDPNNGVTIFFNTFSGDMYRAIGIARASTNPHHNSMTTDLAISNVPIFGGDVPLGIKLFDGDGHSVKKNTIGPGTGEFAAGLTITSFSAGNSVANNNITGDVAITIASDSNQVKNNRITGDDTFGVELVGANFNHVNNNKITCLGGATGVSLDGSSDNNRVIVNRFTGCGTKVADGGSGNTVKNK